ncbi:unnamed protein product [Prorocentrum cordatum]|uniref:Uncharacterized protein n=1 Tax=Prorocentrum cordatum TaxID=2364126 RepID=A0ABN9SBH6_9DINO|nr:unnamed protein product [Polarella glacialis]
MVCGSGAGSFRSRAKRGAGSPNWGDRRCARRVARGGPRRSTPRASCCRPRDRRWSSGGGRPHPLLGLRVRAHAGLDGRQQEYRDRRAAQAPPPWRSRALRGGSGTGNCDASAREHRHEGDWNVARKRVNDQTWSTELSCRVVLSNVRVSSGALECS